MGTPSITFLVDSVSLLTKVNGERGIVPHIAIALTDENGVTTYSGFAPSASGSMAGAGRIFFDIDNPKRHENAIYIDQVSWMATHTLTKEQYTAAAAEVKKWTDNPPQYWGLGKALFNSSFNCVDYARAVGKAAGVWIYGESNLPQGIIPEDQKIAQGLVAQVVGTEGDYKIVLTDKQKNPQNYVGTPAYNAFHGLEPITGQPLANTPPSPPPIITPSTNPANNSFFMLPQSNNASSSVLELSTATQPLERVFEVYQIKKGDTLSVLAQRYGLSENLLLATNPYIKDRNKIFVGDDLVVPIAFASKTSSLQIDDFLLKSSTVSDLTKLTGYNFAALQTANPTINLNALTLGQPLNLPTTLTNAFNLPSTITANAFDGISWLSPDIKTSVSNSGINLDLGALPSPIVLPTLPDITGVGGSPLTTVTKDSTTSNYKEGIRTFLNFGTPITVSSGGTSITNYDGFYYTEGVGSTTSKYYDFAGSYAYSLAQTQSIKTTFIDNYNVTLPTITSTYNWLNINTNFGSAYNGLNFTDVSGIIFAPKEHSIDQSIQKIFEEFHQYEAQVDALFKFTSKMTQTDPIIWDMNGDGFHITSAQTSNVHFDVDNDGYYEKTAWFSGGAGQDAALAIDLNGNGKVDGAWELVSEYFNAKPTTGKSYANGFDVLKEFDSVAKGGNGDGIINSNDLVASKLFWWRDDGDGIYESGEYVGFYGSLTVNPTTTSQNYNGSLLAATATHSLGGQVGQFYFNAYADGIAFTKESNGAIYTLNESNKRLGQLADSGSNTVNMTDKNLRAANGGAGNDLITGSASDNVIAGGTGSDTLNGGAGNDTLYIDAEDKLANINGGDGFDTLVITQTSSVNISMSAMSIEQVVASSGDDIIAGVGGSSVFVKAGAGKDVVMGSSANDLINGELGDDLLMGGAGDDIVRGELGEDTLIGGEGADWLFGGAGNDTYVVDNVLDKVVESVNEGVDEVQSSISYTLTDNVENITLLAGALNANGNSLNNKIVGNNTNNCLDGLVGDDFLDGGAGIDTLVGGLGSDSYVVDTTTDTITENLNEVSYVLGANLDALTLTGLATNGTGNVLANTLIGNSLNNILDGGVGADTLLGGLGDDTYIVDNTMDIVIENASEGLDTVQSSVTYSLLANIENLTLTGTLAINGTGNALSNNLIGNGANNTLRGLLGNDTLNEGVGATVENLVLQAANDDEFWIYKKNPTKTAIYCVV
jgi:Ca2+-binding RTX toxin-like protein